MPGTSEVAGGPRRSKWKETASEPPQATGRAAPGEDGRALRGPESPPGSIERPPATIVNNISKRASILEPHSTFGG